MKIAITGGWASINSVGFQSDEFSSCAHFNRDGSITCDTKRASPLWRFFKKHKNIPIPKLAILITLSLASLTKKKLIMLGLYLLTCLLANILLQHISEVQFEKIINSAEMSIIITIVVGFLFSFRSLKKISPWHGAEHMTCHAYERKGSIEIEDINHESPIHKDCGSRVFVPLITETMIIWLIPEISLINRMLFVLIAVECTLWVDSLIGWNKIPGFAHASIFIQKYISTRKPGINELKTAQKAIQALIAAHDSLQFEK